MYIKAKNILVNADHIIKIELTDTNKIIVTFNNETSVELFSEIEKDKRKQVFELIYEALNSGRNIDDKMIEFKLDEIALKKSLKKTG